MANRNAQEIFNILKFVAIFSFVLSCGSCFACNSESKIQYGEEEYYQKPGGGIGYAAKASTTSERLITILP